MAWASGDHFAYSHGGDDHPLQPQGHVLGMNMRQAYGYTNREMDELMDKLIKNEGEAQGVQRFLHTAPRDTHEEPPKECKLDKLEEVLPDGQWAATFTATWTGGLSKSVKKRGRTPQDAARKLQQAVCTQLQLDFHGRSGVLDVPLPPQQRGQSCSERLAQEEFNPSRENRFRLAHADFDFEGRVWEPADLRVLSIHDGLGYSKYAFAVYCPDIDMETWRHREHFKSQIEIGGVIVRIKPVMVDLEMSCEGRTDEQVQDILLDYNAEIVGDINWAGGDEQTPFLIIRLKGVEGEGDAEPLLLDIEGMLNKESEDEPLQEDCQQHLPLEAFTLDLIRHEFHSRYHTWVAFQKHTPIHPTPAADILEVILGTDPAQRRSKVPESACKHSRVELAASGRAILHVLLAAAAYTKNHLHDAGRLEDWLEAQLAPARVAHLLIDSKVLALTKERVDDIVGASLGESELEEKLEEITMALVGAFAKAGGHFYSAAQLWSWLDQEIVFDEWFKPISFIFFGPIRYFLGRTTTYDRISEEVIDGEPCLKVNFRPNEATAVGEKTIYFRRRHSPPRTDLQERRPCPQESEDGESWQDVSFDTAKQAYVSKFIPVSAETDPDKAPPSNMQDFLAVPPPDKKKEESYDRASVVFGGRPVPNKISLWLNGVPIRALMNVKMFKGNTTIYARLQERKTGNKGIEELKVTYGQHPGHFRELFYLRDFSHETLGYEREYFVNGVYLEYIERPLVYSEKDKTLYSPVLDGPLPQKVMSWLTRGVCLASLVSPRPQIEGPGPKHEEVLRREETEIDCVCLLFRTSICWPSRARASCYGYRTEGNGCSPDP
mmetsp:Transcript_48265/g.114790  ORF Transcript_48265/g.114790 Transcript_48265/m.114790 type:complete len:832 (-) Transcript_48265:1198-3693(-)